MKLEDSIALVFGGARGIGRSLCQALLAERAKVLLCDILEAEGRATCEQLAHEARKDRVVYQFCDVTREEDIIAAYEEVKRAFGPPDIILNNAGTVHEGEWERMLDINLGGVIKSTREALKHISKNSGGKGGVIVNTSSLTGVTTLGIWSPIYSATKAAIVHYTRIMSSGKQFETHGIRMMCLCPSVVDTALVTEVDKPGRTDFYEVQHAFIEAKRKEGFIHPDTVGAILIDMLRRDEELNGAAAVIEGETPEFLYVTSRE